MLEIHPKEIFPMAAQYTVATSSELTSVLSQLKGGETVYLKAGDYGNLTLTGKYASTVTFTSVDVDQPATFNMITFNGAKNITIDAVKVDLQNHPAEAYKDVGVRVSNSSNIEISNSDVSSNASSQNAISTTGIYVRGSSNVVLDNNTISEFGWGSVVQQSSNVAVSNNTYHDNLGDNARYASDISNIVVEGNTFYPPALDNPLNTHQDNIQFWTTDATKDSANIVVRGNTIYNYTESTVQNIFMRGDYLNSADGLSNEFRYENVVIEENVIVGNHAHGITISAADGVTIQNNTVLYAGLEAHPDAVNVPKINVSSSTGVTVVDNVTNGVNISESSAQGAVVQGNIIVDRHDSDSPSYVGNLFVNADQNQFPTAADLVPLPGGLLDKGNGDFVGALQVQPSTTAVTALASVSSELVDGNFVYAFDAGASLGVAGAALEGASYSWKFADGTVLNGESVSHSFTTSGHTEVTLTVTDAQGRSDSFVRELTVRDTQVLQLNFEQGAQDLTGNASGVIVANPTYVDGPYGKALHLAGGTDRVTINRADIDLGGTGQFTFSTSLQLEAGATSRMTVLSDHGNWGLYLNPTTGAAQLAVASKFYNFPANAALADGQWHDLALTIDASGTTLYVDGKVAGVMAANEALLDLIDEAGRYGYSVGGTPWGNAFQGNIDNLAIFSKTLSATDIQTLHSHQPAIPEVGIELNGDANANTLQGTAYADHLYGDAGRDRIDAGAGNDRVDGGVHSDTLSGGVGNDTLIGGHANDMLTGGAGRDVFVVKDINHSAGANYYGKAAPVQGDLITDFTHGEDIIDLSATGYHSLVEAGQATQVGQLEYNVTNTGTVLYDPFSNFAMTLQGVAQLWQDDISFAAQPNPGLQQRPDGSFVLDVKESFAKQTLDSYVVQTGDKADAISIQNYEGDVVATGGGNDVVRTGFGNDTIYGDEGNDSLYGEAHNDALHGGAGNDLLNGGLHNDVLHGGAGADIFQFTKNFGQDVIKDFEAGSDVIELLGTGLFNFEAVQSATVYDLAHATAVIKAADGSSITVVGVDRPFDQADFRFG